MIVCCDGLNLYDVHDRWQMHYLLYLKLVLKSQQLKLISVTFWMIFPQNFYQLLFFLDVVFCLLFNNFTYHSHFTILHLPYPLFTLFCFVVVVTVITVVLGSYSTLRRSLIHTQNFFIFIFWNNNYYWTRTTIIRLLFIIFIQMCYHLFYILIHRTVVFPPVTIWLTLFKKLYFKKPSLTIYFFTTRKNNKFKII